MKTRVDLKARDDLAASCSDKVRTQWQLYLLLRRILLNSLVLFFGGFSTAFAVACVTGILPGWWILSFAVRILMILVAITAIPMIVLGWILLFWRCPRCGRSFNFYRGFKDHFWPPAHYGLLCSNCGVEAGDVGWCDTTSDASQMLKP